LKFYKTSFEERNDIYSREVIDLGEKVLDKALKKSGWKPEDLDYNYCELHWNYDSFIRRYLINKLKYANIVRLPVTEMGCAAGISGIIYAKNFLV
jgi:predicted naringenin-chalcone synthase